MPFMDLLKAPWRGVKKLTGVKNIGDYIGKDKTKAITSGIKGALATGLPALAVGGPVAGLIGAGVGGAAGIGGAGQVAQQAIDKTKALGGQAMDALSGTPGGFIGADIYTPEQKQALEQLLQMSEQNMNNPYEGFDPIRQAALSNFYQEIVPHLQEGFSGSGDNSYSSPQLQTNLSSAGAGLAERLAALQAGYGQQNKQFGLQQLQTGLNPYQQMGYQQRQPGFGENVLNSLIGTVPGLYGQYSNQQNQLSLLNALRKQ